MHSRFQTRDQLYIYLALQQNLTDHLSPRTNRSYTLATNGRLIDDDIAGNLRLLIFAIKCWLEFRLSNDERIRSYMTINDWKDELYEANEQQWCVNGRKFNDDQVIRE